ncbi:unnamed protein product [Lymnaea stagnalis]|uniref:SOCS box domain-containing protein n=1 Tax=Lymnaea stagnalis TaxID=6523 RepID=A0AAV2HTY6_LYMST
MSSYLQGLFNYIRGTWPATVFLGKTWDVVSEQSKDSILKIIWLLQCPEEKSSDVVQLLRQLPTGEDWFSVKDIETGFDILQSAVISRNKDVVKYLLSFCVDLDCYHCSSPVHLAAYLGEKGILQILSERGANVNKKLGMCYPQPHKAISYEPHYFSFSKQPVYLCKTRRLTPVQCAILRNQLSCVQIILEQERLKVKQSLSPQNLLMYSCQEGAPDCIRYFADLYPDCINKYMKGDTPLLAAVPWGEQCAKILLESGADVHLRSESIQETALHRLYRQNIDGLFTIYDTTKYLLTTGIEQEVNTYTHLKETALHMLVSHISYTGGNYVDPQRQLPRAQLQESYQSQVLAAIRLLLEFNADPHLLNGTRLTPLSRLLHIGLKVVHKADKCECVRTSQPDIYIGDYKHDYEILAKAMEILFEFKSDSNFMCQVGHTPLILLLQFLLYDDLANLCAQSTSVLRTVEVLLKNEAEPNFTDGAHGTAHSLIAMICHRCMQDDPENLGVPLGQSPLLREQFGELVNEVLCVMLRHGLDPNHKSNKISRHLQGGQGNGLIEFVSLVSTASSNAEFQLVEKWIRTLLQWGADPDLEPYPSEPIICHCQSSIFLKKLPTQPLAHLIHEVKDKENLLFNKSVQNILLLFYNTMDHKALHGCLTASKSILHLQPSGILLDGLTVSSLCDGSVDFLTLINMMSGNPQSLKELSRVSIYKSLKHNLASKVESLPLPSVVKKYVLEIAT